MSHSYVHNPVHVVFSTKDRRKVIPKEAQPRLWAYLAGVCKKQEIFVHEIGGMEDHLHMLIQIPLTLSFADAMQEIKTSSSRWMGRRLTHGDAVGYPVVAPDGACEYSEAQSSPG
jgi:putative transposase